MTLPRSVLIDTEFTAFYHCMSRCVRRAFLCGRDRETGFDFSHRKSWIESRIKLLANVFAIDVCAYAVMSNHYHLVLHINRRQQAVWTDAEVIERWGRLHSLPEWLDSADDARKVRTIATWRERLASISWFMKGLNEPLARMANQEDGCKGRFWEGRFKSQALLDEASLLKCMAYVDLNPIRANQADTPEDSAHTSIQARITGRDRSLAPMADQRSNKNLFHLPIRQQDYLHLVSWTGRQVHPAKQGLVKNESAPAIVQRLRRFTPRDWIHEMQHLSRLYVRAIGTHVSLTVFREQIGQSRLKGLVN